GGGVVDAAWPVNGRALCTATGSQTNVAIVPDLAGGAVVSWQDARNGSANTDVYAQHVLANGTADPGRTANGRPLGSATGNQIAPVLASDGAGGAIGAWQDQRSGTFDVYAQRVNRLGGFDNLIVASSGAHGSIAPPGTLAVPNGGSATYFMTP